VASEVEASDREKRREKRIYVRSDSKTKDVQSVALRKGKYSCILSEAEVLCNPVGDQVKYIIYLSSCSITC